MLVGLVGRVDHVWEWLVVCYYASCDVDAAGHFNVVDRRGAVYALNRRDGDCCPSHVAEKITGPELPSLYPLSATEERLVQGNRQATVENQVLSDFPRAVDDLDARRRVDREGVGRQDLVTFADLLDELAGAIRHLDRSSRKEASSAAWLIAKAPHWGVGRGAVVPNTSELGTGAVAQSEPHHVSAFTVAVETFDL